MSGLFDFLSELFKSEDKKDTSVIVKNYNINGSGNQNSKTPSNNIPKKHNGTTKSKASGSSAHTRVHSTNSPIRVRSIRFYSTGAKGRVYTDRFYKSINHNFGIEVVISNDSSTNHNVDLGHCIYNENGVTILRGNFHLKIAPHTQFTQCIYVPPQTFNSMKNGKYKSQLWLNKNKVQKAFFTIANK